MTLDEITQKILKQIDEKGFKQDGAFNLRHNGTALCHGDSEHIKIKKKEDKQGIDVYIDGNTKGEQVHIPVVGKLPVTFRETVRFVVPSFLCLTVIKDGIRGIHVRNGQLSRLIGDIVICGHILVAVIQNPRFGGDDVPAGDVPGAGLQGNALQRIAADKPGDSYLIHTCGNASAAGDGLVAGLDG